MQKKTSTDYVSAPVASKVLRDSKSAAADPRAEKTSYRKFAAERREDLRKSADTRASKMVKSR